MGSCICRSFFLSDVSSRGRCPHLAEAPSGTSAGASTRTGAITFGIWRQVYRFRGDRIHLGRRGVCLSLPVPSTPGCWCEGRPGDGESSTGRSERRVVLRAIGCSRCLNSFALPGVLVGVCLLEGVCFPPSITSWRRQLREKVPLVDPLCKPSRPLRSSLNFLGISRDDGDWHSTPRCMMESE